MFVYHYIDKLYIISNKSKDKKKLNLNDIKPPSIVRNWPIWKFNIS